MNAKLMQLLPWQRLALTEGLEEGLRLPEVEGDEGLSTEQITKDLVDGEK